MSKIQDASGALIPHNRRDTSIQAAQRAAGFAASLRERVYGIVYEMKLRGATCEDVEDRLPNTHQSISARFWELAQDYRIIDSGRRRQNRSKTEAIVWIAAEHVPVTVIAPFVAYARAQFAIEAIRRALSALDKVMTLSSFSEDASGVFMETRALLREQQHAYERVAPPAPIIDDADSVTVLSADGHVILL